MPEDQDQSFSLASPQEQHAYLMATDEDYAKASPSDQRAYLDHVNAVNLKTGVGMEAYSQRQARQSFIGTGEEGNYDLAGRKISGPQGQPLSLMEQATQAQADRETRQAVAQSRAASSPVPLSVASSAFLPVAALGHRAALPFLIRTTAGGIAGSAAGGYGGGKAGGIFGPKGQQYGSQLGALFGGLAGMYVGGRGTPTGISSIDKRLGLEKAFEPVLETTEDIGLQQRRAIYADMEKDLAATRQRREQRIADIDKEFSKQYDAFQSDLASKHEEFASRVREAEQSRLKEITDWAKAGDIHEADMQAQAADLEKRMTAIENARQEWISDWAKAGKMSEADHAAFAKQQGAIESERLSILADMERLKEQHAAALHARGGVRTSPFDPGGGGDAFSLRGGDFPPRPLTPLVATPEEVGPLGKTGTVAQRMFNMEKMAKDLGMYSAAYGKVGRKLTYGERAGGAISKPTPSAPLPETPSGVRSTSEFTKGGDPILGYTDRGEPVTVEHREAGTAAGTRRSVYEMSKMKTEMEAAKTEEMMAKEAARGKSKVKPEDEGYVMQRLLKNPEKWAAYRKLVLEGNKRAASEMFRQEWNAMMRGE